MLPAYPNCIRHFCKQTTAGKRGLVKGDMVVARGGFTLVELLLVLGILATLAAVSLPAIVRWQQRASLEQAASSVQLQMQTARASAVRSGIDWQICFTTNRQQQVVCRLEAIHSHGV